MKPVHSLAMRVAPWAIPVLTIGIVVFDLLTPVGVAVSILYVIPLLLTFFSPRKRNLIYFSLVATAFTWIGLFFKPPGIQVPYGMFNRSLGTLVLWGVALGLIYHKRMQKGLISAEGALKTAQKGFEDIFEASKDAIGYAGLDGTILRVNRAFAELTGFSSEELTRMNARDLISEQHKAQRDRVVARVFQTGEPVEYEIDYLRKNGSLVPVSISLFVVKEDDGKPSGLAAIVRDLSERKQTEEALRERTELLNIFIRYAPVAIAMLDSDMRYLVVSQRWMADYHLGDEDLVGRSHYDAFPDVPEHWKAVHRRSLTGEVVRMDEERFHRSDDSEQWLRWEVRPWCKVDGAVGGIVIFTEDITEQKRAKEQFRLVVESSPNGVLMVGKDGVILLVNRQIEQLFGYERAELVGQSVEMLVPQHKRSNHAGDRAEFFAHSESRAMGKGRDLFGVRKDGTEFPLEIGLSPIRTPNGMSVLASVVDISERKRIQEQLRKTERLAELGTLASGMAHEIGTPMNVILGRAEYLLQRTTDEGMKKGLTTIVTQIERITKVMNQLLAFARRKPPERRPVDLAQSIDDSLEMFHERMAHSRIAVEKAIESDLPPVHADQDQIVQVLINLVMNSIHAMPEGGRLRLSLAREGDYVRLEVADTGHGMPEEVCAKVFDPFFTTKDFGKGTGLGLTVVKGIIEEHGGTIALVSAVEKGTTFTIRFPISQDQSAGTSLSTGH